MKGMTGIGFIFAGTVLVMLCNGIWYQGKFALQRKGYPMNLFFNHFRDFRMMDQAVTEETDPVEQVRLRQIYNRMKAIWIIFPIAAALFIVGAFLLSLQQ